MAEEATQDAWYLLVPVQVALADRAIVLDFSDRVPDARWFWHSLAHHHVMGFTGIDEYEFTHEAVRWACGDEMNKPHAPLTGPWRDSRPGDPSELAIALRSLAADLRESDAVAAGANPFWEPATPASWGDLLVQLAEWLERPLAPTS